MNRLIGGNFTLVWKYKGSFFEKIEFKKNKDTRYFLFILFTYSIVSSVIIYFFIEFTYEYMNKYITHFPRLFLIISIFQITFRTYLMDVRENEYYTMRYKNRLTLDISSVANAKYIKPTNELALHLCVSHRFSSIEFTFQINADSCVTLPTLIESIGPLFKLRLYSHHRPSLINYNYFNVCKR